MRGVTVRLEVVVVVVVQQQQQEEGEEEGASEGCGTEAVAVRLCVVDECAPQRGATAVRLVLEPGEDGTCVSARLVVVEGDGEEGAEGSAAQTSSAPVAAAATEAALDPQQRLAALRAARDAAAAENWALQRAARRVSGWLLTRMGLPQPA